MTAEHSQDVVRKFTQDLGANSSSALRMLRQLEWQILPFNAIEESEKELLIALVQGAYAYPHFEFRVYFINNAGLAVVDAYKERQEI